jgi:ABC-type transport system involved in cytochrome c biogenesis permease subunit
LIDAIAGAKAADDERVFRVENLELLDTIGLPRRPGAWRYSFNELREKSEPLSKQIELAGAEAKAQRPLSLYQRKVIELYNKISYYALLTGAFQSPTAMVKEEERAELVERAGEIRLAMLDDMRTAPKAVPPLAPSAEWQPLAAAELEWVEQIKNKQPVNPVTMSLRSLLDSYRRQDVTTFNQHLALLQQSLKSFERTQVASSGRATSPAAAANSLLSQSRLDFEAFFNQFSPFYYCAALYLIAFLLGVASWLGWTVPLRRASIWLVWLTFVVHTFALAARIYISGRPPITNLYSAAVFIGWGGTLLAMMMEYIFRLGLGNIVAAVLGFITLVVAHFLSLDGDTMIVLQAVLDTQFWLATHVVCIALGYATTYVAGLFGILYILLAHVFPVLGEHERRELTRMTYGALCFAILFSFFGTVLGGLWADDSWGRFWGWDPKENGALIIVLYNALVLHARWGGLVKPRGMALLTIGGNIVVTWSFFGVNELGVGLHSYGASESSTAMWLLTFAMSQLAIIALGALPRRWFETLASSRLPAAT